MGRLKTASVILALASVTFLISSCATKVARKPVEQQIDLSGRWNDSDNRMVSEEMIKDCLARPWVDVFAAKNNRQPVVIVGTIQNRSSEHVDSMMFTQNLERSLTNSGKVRFVAMNGVRDEVRAEKDDQAAHASQATRKTPNQETGADFMVQGTINSVKDEVDGKYVMLYQVNLEMVDMTTNEKVWIGQKEIKKYVSKSLFGW
ncbi:MAG: penicillin-binding protein activator LpoB [Deltaproteobacteria bacterium]